MGKSTVTDEHFDIFGTEVERLIKKWGMSDWKVYLERRTVAGARGGIVPDVDNHTATIYLSNGWESTPSRSSLLFCAQHETVHLVVSPLAWLAECRWITQSEVNTERERLVRHLQSIIFGNNTLLVREKSEKEE